MLKLTDPDPIFIPFQLNGEDAKYDPFKLAEDIARAEKPIVKGDDGQPTEDSGLGLSSFDAIRQGLGLPLQAAVDAATAKGETPPKTLSRYQCLLVMAALGDFIEGLPASKKLSARMQK